MKITHVLGLTILAGTLSGCFLLEDYPANVARLNSELNYICTTGINTNHNSASYRDCRAYYDSLLLQYDVDPSRPNSWEITSFVNRTRPVASRCRGYSSSTSYVFSCVREQEDIMLSEWIRQKHIRERQEAERELIREQERERDRYARERDRRNRDHHEHMDLQHANQPDHRGPDNQHRYDKGEKAQGGPHMNGKPQDNPHSNQKMNNKPHDSATQMKEKAPKQQKGEVKHDAPKKESPQKESPKQELRKSEVPGMNSSFKKHHH